MDMGALRVHTHESGCVILNLKSQLPDPRAVDTWYLQCRCRHGRGVHAQNHHFL